MSGVFETIITGKYRDAREQSIRESTSTPDSSGLSKEAGFAESKSPYLSMRAALREASENNFIYFMELRFGVASPRGFSTWPSDFDLAPLVEAIDSAFARLKASGLRSATLARSLMVTSLEQDGLLPEEDRDTIERELEESAATSDGAPAPTDEVPTPPPVGASARRRFRLVRSAEDPNERVIEEINDPTAA